MSYYDSNMNGATTWQGVTNRPETTTSCGEIDGAICSRRVCRAHADELVAQIRDAAHAPTRRSPRVSARFAASSVSGRRTRHRLRAALVQISGNGLVPVTIGPTMPAGLSFGIVKLAVRLMPGPASVGRAIGRLIVTIVAAI